MSLFDEQDLAEIESAELYPDERFWWCEMNPLLAEERARKRKELLAVTEAKLERVAQAVRRERRPPYTSRPRYVVAMQQLPSR